MPFHNPFHRHHQDQDNYYGGNNPNAPPQQQWGQQQAQQQWNQQQPQQQQWDQQQQLQGQWQPQQPQPQQCNEQQPQQPQQGGMAQPGKRQCSQPGQGDIIGAVTTGYQGWFTCEGDTSPLKGWWHWAPNRLSKMCKDNCAVISWPDMRYYEVQHDTTFAPYPNGTPSRLFSNMDAQTVYAHFRMMQDAEINTAALQRFVPCGPEGPPRDITTVHVANAAMATGVKWYCMWDVGGWKNMRTELPQDWVNKMSQYANSPAYARQNGKPVVAIWGFGFNDDNHPFTPEECIEVIRWLQNAGLSFDCLSPWMVGRASKTADLDHYYREANKGDVEELRSLGIDYQPCVMPGDLATGRRLHGDFYWHHFHNLAKLGPEGVGLYVSMFDEYNEGHHIAPTAETKNDQPADFPHPALDEDGVACTADYYLRVTKDGGAMFKGRLPLTNLRPTEPWPGKGPQHTPKSVLIKAMVNGKYVCAEPDGHLINDREEAGPWEKWTVEHTADGRARFKAHTGKYLCCEPSGNIVANREQAGPWETFEIIANDDGRITIKTWQNKFIQAIPEGKGRMVAGADEAGWWESFGLEDA